MLKKVPDLTANPKGEFRTAPLSKLDRDVGMRPRALLNEIAAALARSGFRVIPGIQGITIFTEALYSHSTFDYLEWLLVPIAMLLPECFN